MAVDRWCADGDRHRAGRVPGQATPPRRPPASTSVRRPVPTELGDRRCLTSCPTPPEPRRGPGGARRRSRRSSRSPSRSCSAGCSWCSPAATRRRRRPGRVVPHRAAGTARRSAPRSTASRSTSAAARAVGWCSTSSTRRACRASDEHPELIAFDEQQARLRRRRRAVHDHQPGQRRVGAARSSTTNGGDWPVVRDPDGRSSVDFGVAQVPETWIIDPNGVVRARYAGRDHRRAGRPRSCRQFREGRG